MNIWGKLMLHNRMRRILPGKLRHVFKWRGRRWNASKKKWVCIKHELSLYMNTQLMNRELQEEIGLRDIGRQIDGVGEGRSLGRGKDYNMLEVKMAQEINQPLMQMIQLWWQIPKTSLASDIQDRRNSRKCEDQTGWFEFQDVEDLEKEKGFR